MSKESNFLSHHERKRLEYLYSNFHYLNEREQLEYKYLLKKSQGAYEESRPTTPEVASTEEVQGEVSEQIGDLPVYQSRSQRSKKKTAVAGGAVKRKKPRRKIRVKRILKWLSLFFLLIIGGMVFMFVKGLNSKPAGKDAKPAVVEKFNGKKSRDGVNILILGTDGRIGEKSDETRTDSIMVVNVNNKEGKIKMVSFMRDTLVHIDGVSQQNIPEYDGYYDQKLNTAFTIGEQNNNQGAELVRQMLKDNFLKGRT
jgi:polyisoprenyl-teichoic acid--peptidoglycan teichoic acid transferase